MRRFTTAIVSFMLSVLFAGLALVALFSAEDGLGSTLAALGIALDAGRVDLLAGKPTFAGMCLGATLVAAMYATAGMSALLDAVGRKAQDEMILDIATGGALAIGGIAGFGAFMADAEALAALAFFGSLVVVAARAALRQPAKPVMPAAPEIAQPARSLAAEAARQVNVVRFPMERTGRGRQTA